MKIRIDRIERISEATLRAYVSEVDESGLVTNVYQIDFSETMSKEELKEIILSHIVIQKEIEKEKQEKTREKEEILQDWKELEGEEYSIEEE
jgi:glycine cleavage system protein P-like pyridoxal-binding family